MESSYSPKLIIDLRYLASEVNDYPFCDERYLFDWHSVELTYNDETRPIVKFYSCTDAITGEYFQVLTRTFDPVTNLVTITDSKEVIYEFHKGAATCR